MSDYPEFFRTRGKINPGGGPVGDIKAFLPISDEMLADLDDWQRRCSNRIWTLRMLEWREGRRWRNRIKAAWSALKGPVQPAA